jgi:Nuclease A inhibitor-like protein
MQDDTTQLLASINSNIQGLLFRTEADYVLKPFVWDVSTRGAFSINSLLKSTGNLVAIEPDDFLSYREYLEGFELWGEMCKPEARQTVRSEATVMEQRFHTLLQILQAHTNGLQVYRVVKYDEGEYSNNYSNDRRSSKYVFESFKILVAKVNEGCWIGISPIRSYIEFPTRPTPEKFLAQRIDPTQAETLELQAKLQPILDSVTFIGRECYDVFDKEHQYACEFAATEDAVIDRLLHLSHFLNTWEFEGMSLGNEGLEGVDDPDDPNDEGKFEAIDRLLRSKLKGLRVHIVGTISMFDIYAVGQIKNGDWLGVSTTAVWT